jgi:hypothetical protein
MRTRKVVGVADDRSERNARLAGFAEVAKGFKNFRHAREVLTRVRAVPTIFPQFDLLTKVGGLPIERFSLLHGPSGGGKALSKETPVLTPHGWKAIGTLVIGDEVITADGSATRVEGVYPQGVVSLYEVSFNDGSTIECCAEHLWFTTTMRERSRGRYTRGPRPERARIPTGVDGLGSVKSLAEIAENFVANDHAIPIASTVNYEPLGHLPIDPYMLGLLLGDGGMTTGQVKFFKPEIDLQAAFTKRLFGEDVGIALPDGSGVRVNGDALKRALMGLDLWGTRSWEKFIPDLYMRASQEDRLALLRGILDTDGSVPKERGAVEYTTTSFRLAEQVAELTRSLGGFVAVADVRRTSFEYLGEKKLGRESSRLRISMPRGVTPVSSKKHLARWRPDLVHERLRTIDGISFKRMGEAVCIRVAHPSRLFVTKDFIVTHNTYWTIGLMLSFLMRDHFAVLVDAERTTPITWLEKAMGEYADHPFFRASRPQTYEGTREDVRRFLTDVRELRNKGKVKEDTTALIVVDSIRKLVPKGEFDRIMKATAEGKDEKEGKFRDRGAQMKAAANSAWMDEIIPLLEETQSAMLVIARETVDPDAPPPRAFAGRTPEKKVVVGGGSALYYDASMNMRSTLLKSYGKKIKVGDQDRMIPYGDLHQLEISKSKVSGKGEQFKGRCTYHISNGVWSPAGFDRARDVIEMARSLDIIEGTSWLKFGSKKWNGEDLAVRALNEKPELLAEIEAECRAFSMTKLEATR